MQALLSVLNRTNAGQGMVEYTLVIGVISLVIVFAFLTTGIESAMGNLASNIAGQVSP